MKIIFLLFITLNFLFSIEIFDVNNQTAKIKVTNLTIGHSGIVIRELDDNKIILTQAAVIKSDNKSSTIKFLENKILAQKAIPTTKLQPQNKDKFILSHLYHTGLLIVPNTKAKQIVKKLYPSQNFLDEDFFAAHLKLIQKPVPTQEVISNFAQKQQIGTIFLVIQNTLYVLDAITFKAIATVSIYNNDTSTNSPFLTKITDIKTSMWSFFDDDKIENYNEYYSKLLENKE